MREREAVELIATAVDKSAGAWADLGAGSGTFTRALRALLPRGSRIYAVDKDSAAITALSKLGDAVVPVEADFSEPFELPASSPLDGMLLANALHFVPNQEDVLRQLVKLLRPGGRIVIVEYDRRAASRWVPYPISSDRWLELAPAARLHKQRITERRPSVYAGELYAAVAERATE